MARPSKNNADYFSHDNDMRNHRKVRAIRSKFGIAGYAIWVMFLEVLTASEENRWNDNELELELLSGDFGVSVTEIKDVIDYCVKLGLLFSENDQVFSKTLDNNLRSVYEKRNKAKLMAQNQAKKQQKQESTGVSVTEIPQSKKEESKVKESKELTEDVDNKLVTEARNEVDSTTTPENDPLPDFIKKNRDDFREEIKQNPPQLRETLPTLDELEEILKASSTLMEAACIGNKISQSDYFDAIDTFVRDKKAVNYVVHSESDVKKHFLYWLPSWKQKITREKQNSQSEKPRGKIGQTYDSVMAANQKIQDEGGYLTYQDILNST
ncbi:DUF4373 domain-containing protein [Dyadobacter bucti]|uniref:DUF4373 domain-containing protein n=1 Tax=Dyadobacter bucti TaxID=2572203 RepID=UPI001108BE20|nr:Lin1244/Lin1753 domain-containing protein [Dyadobacter bucti]